MQESKFIGFSDAFYSRMHRWIVPALIFAALLIPTESFAEKNIFSVSSYRNGRVLVVRYRLTQKIVRKARNVRLELRGASNHFRLFRAERPRKRSSIRIRKMRRSDREIRMRVMKGRKVLLETPTLRFADDPILVPTPVPTETGTKIPPTPIPLDPTLTECPQGFEDRVVELTNIHRASLGLPSVARSPYLDAAAREHSIAMTSGGLVHDGWVDEITRTGYSWTFLAQNIAKIFTSPDVVFEAWIRSTGHRYNIEHPRALEIGVSCIQGSDGVFWWTQDFGSTQIAQ